MRTPYLLKKEKENIPEDAEEAGLTLFTCHVSSADNHFLAPERVRIQYRNVLEKKTPILLFL